MKLGHTHCSSLGLVTGLITPCEQALDPWGPWHMPLSLFPKIWPAQIFVSQIWAGQIWGNTNLIKFCFVFPIMFLNYFLKEKWIPLHYDHVPYFISSGFQEFISKMNKCLSCPHLIFKYLLIKMYLGPIFVTFIPWGFFLVWFYV